MRSVAVIGKNFGDEGKGLVTASLCFSCQKPLIIKHNGGAQAGHTVENMSEGKRFVHHQTGSGSEYGAATLFAAGYHPDLYQLGKEIEDFRHTFGFVPEIYSEADTAITTIDDVLINMALETERGQSRHGSCGMGIYECVLRGEASLQLTMREIAESSEEELLKKLLFIRRHYSLERLGKICPNAQNQYTDMLKDDSLLGNFVRIIRENLRYVKIINADRPLLEGYDTIVFETGQGLLLDEGNSRFSPHVTASKTGIAEPTRFLLKRGLALDEAVYVTRPYVTRHGAGMLPCECSIHELPGVAADLTNIPNEWQGSIRYAKHESPGAFFEPLIPEKKLYSEMTGGNVLHQSLAVTHLNETNGLIYFADRTVPVAELMALSEGGPYGLYESYDRETLRFRQDAATDNVPGIRN